MHALLILLRLLAEPTPDQASGVEIDDARPASEHWLWLPRAALFVPRAAVWAVGQPIRGAAYAYEEYELPGRLREIFFNVDGTLGVYPIATYESGIGFMAGARAVHKDLFGEGERLRLRVDVGGRFRQAYGANARSGRRFGRVAVELDASYERRPNEKLYGIGNTSDAMETTFHEDVARGVAAIDVKVAGALHARTSGAIMDRRLDLAGHGDRVRNVYVEQELAYDSRRPASPYQSEAFDGTGWLARAYAGVTRGLPGDASRFVTYGGELQRYFDLYRGSRTLAVRALVDAVAGDEVSFIDLPRLGGSELLRGYASGRFRDRAVALATVEYGWDLGNFLAAYAFVDVGRTYASLTDVELAGLRMGYGGGVQVHTGRSFLMRAQLAASLDHDVYVQLAFSPSFGRRERAGRF